MKTLYCAPSYEIVFPKNINKYFTWKRSICANIGVLNLQQLLFFLLITEQYIEEKEITSVGQVQQTSNYELIMILNESNESRKRNIKTVLVK